MKKKTIVLIKVFGGILIGLGLLYAVVLLSSAISLRNAYAELKKAGRPMLASDVIPPALADTENAAPLYEAAMKILSAAPAVDGNSSNLINNLDNFKSPDLKSDSKTINELHEILQSDDVKEVLLLVEKGNLRQKCRYNLEYQNGPATLLPHLQWYRCITRIICFKANIENRDGKINEAWHTVICGLKFANSLKEEPFLISQLVRMACFLTISLEMQNLFQLSSPDEKQIVEILTELKLFEDINPFVKSLDAERLLLGEYVFTMSPSKLNSVVGDGKDMPLIIRIVLSSIPTWEADHATYLRVLNNSAQTAGYPYSETKDKWKKMILDIPKYHIISKALLPALTNCKIKNFNMIAKARIMVLGIKLIQFKETKGIFPKQLDELGTVNTIDPFTGKNLIYKPEEKGFFLYSVGENLIDDKGNCNPESKPNDIGWRYSEATAKN